MFKSYRRIVAAQSDFAKGLLALTKGDENGDLALCATAILT